METVWISVDKSKPMSDRDRIKVFANAGAANQWMTKNAVEGVAVECEVTSDRKPRARS